MAIEGFQDGGTAVEPTTGNDVPVGALPNEVADDIPARLSEGEFVIPADVVRFIGLERLMKLRDEAKEGLRRMAEVGQMGNAQEVGEKAEESFEEDTEGFESDIDDILSEIDSVEGQTEQAFAKGGVVGGAPWLTGFDLKKAPKNPVFDVRYYKHPDGRIMYVTFFNGKPMTPIPNGFTETDSPVDTQSGKEEEKKPVTTAPPTSIDTTTGGGVGGESQGGPAGPDVSSIATGDPSSLAQSTTVSPNAVIGVAAALTAMGIPGAGLLARNANSIAASLSNASGARAGAANIDAVGKAFGFDTTTAEGRAAASSVIDSMSSFQGGSFATAGQTGTGGAAASAGASAAAGAAAMGLSASAQAAASQAAADAVVGGKASAEAISAGIDAGVAADAEGGKGGPAGGSLDAAGNMGLGGSEAGGAGDAGAGLGGGGESGGDGGGYGGVMAKGGLVSKRKNPAKKIKGKGLAAR